jgi:hypothetical protein
MSATVYTDCVRDTALKFAKGPDPANVVVEAAMLKCRAILSRYINDAPAKSLAGSQQAKNMIRETLESLAREEALLRVIETRSNYAPKS